MYHGKSAVLLGIVPRGRVDLQSFDADGKGAVGMKEAFLQNLRVIHGATPSLRVVAASSASLTARDVPGEFTFCHIDGDHSQRGMYVDFDFCYQVLRPGGIIAVDDYFNQMFPGVAEGGFRWGLHHPGALVPVAIGYNKIIFHKPLRGFDINAKFTRRFRSTPHSVTQLWDEPAHLFTAGPGQLHRHAAVQCHRAGSKRDNPLPCPHRAFGHAGSGRNEGRRSVCLSASSTNPG